jgi:colanic acid biosynthesis glycosyl transferase WcaI
MNILIVSQYFWPESFRINDLAEGLKEQGHSLTVLTGIPNYPEGRFFSGYGFFTHRREQWHGINIIRVPLIPRGGGGGLRLALNYLSFAYCGALLAPVLCRGRYDLIFVYEPSPITVGIPALVIKFLRRIPIIFWVQDLWPESLSATGAVTSRLALGLVDRLVRLIYAGCDLVLVQSRAFLDVIQSQGVPPDRIQYFPNGAEELYRPIHPDTATAGAKELPEGFRVIFAGNLGAAQDFTTILTAAEMLKQHTDIHWIIIGDGRVRCWVAEQIKVRGLEDSVVLLGRKPSESMPHYFALADVLLVTLKKMPVFALTIPSKLQSYLACGRPVVAALEGEGARVVEESGAGFVAQPEDPKGLAAAVLAMYDASAEQRAVMGKNGRRYFEEHFERSVLIQHLEQWISEVTHPRR